MTPWRIDRATQTNHSEKNVALRCATGTTDQSKTRSESQWLIVAGLFALGREFHCDMLATISTPASLAALLELEMEQIYASSGSACHAGSQDPSHVLLAIGRSPELAHTALRLTLGAPTTDTEVDRVIELLPRVVERVRAGVGVR